MGRVLQGNTVATSGGGSGSNSASLALTAAVPIAQNDLLQTMADGLVSPVGNVDYAASSAGPVSGSPFTAGSNLPGGTLRYPSQQGADGSLFALVNKSTSGTAISVSKLNPVANAEIASLLLDSPGPLISSAQLLKLSNGNFAAIWSSGGSGTSYWFAIFDSTLTPIVTKTLIDTIANAPSQPYSIALSGGGFAITYQKSNAQMLAIRNNNGGITLAPTSVFALSGGISKSTSSILGELSSGNIVLAFKSAYTTTSGFYCGIYGATGSVVSAIASLDTTAEYAWIEFSAMPGYFSLATTIGFTGIKSWIFNNEGTLQGANFSGSTSNPGGAQFKLVNDGANDFFLIWDDSSFNSSKSITRLPKTGTSYVTNHWSVALIYGAFIDGFVERGMIYVQQYVSEDAATAGAVFSTSTLARITTGVSNAGVPALAAIALSVLPLGDFSVLLYATNSAGQPTLCVLKYAYTSIVGVAQEGTAAGTMVSLSVAPGPYPINPVRGGVPKSFDFTTAGNGLIGNKGSILAHGAILKGI
jgi:hypothetical protein